MLIKILLLSVLAYYVFRAAGNLIEAVRRDGGLPESGRRPPGPRRTQRAGAQSDNRDASRPATVRDDSEDIEDARFEDL